MSRRVCVELGCPELTDRRRCHAHERAADAARGTTANRGYGARHQALRRQWQRRVDGGGITCWRCGTPITGSQWDLGHDDHDRTTYRGPECVACNRAVNAPRGDTPKRGER